MKPNECSEIPLTRPDECDIMNMRHFHTANGEGGAMKQLLIMWINNASECEIRTIFAFVRELLHH